jgi:hypothetical protein
LQSFVRVEVLGRMAILHFELNLDLELANLAKSSRGPLPTVAMALLLTLMRLITVEVNYAIKVSRELAHQKADLSLSSLVLSSSGRPRPLWRQIRTVSDSAKIENLQNHKTILENQNSHISYTFIGKLDLKTYISQIYSTPMTAYTS